MGESRIACPKLETSKVGRVDTSIEAKTSVVGELDEPVTAVDEEVLADRVGRVAGSDTYGGPNDGGSGFVRIRLPGQSYGKEEGARILNDCRPWTVKQRPVLPLAIGKCMKSVPALVR